MLIKKNIEWAVWLSRSLRWGFGAFSIWLGIRNDHNWPAIIFGAALFITGFFKPIRCINENCES